MRREMTIALCLASLSGMVAAVGAYDWISSLADSARKRPAVVETPAIDLTKVVVAKESLSFGTVLTKDNLRVVDWPAGSEPAGAYKTVEDLLAEQETRTVLEPIQHNEPVMKTKITGPGQRATLSTMLRNGMKAVSVRVDDVVGVAGFVVPGDYVDVLMTFGKRVEEDKKATQLPFTDLLIQKLRVLAIDQTADPRIEGAKLARTVTLEASQQDAQKITLAANIATLSLILREQIADADPNAHLRITSSDLDGDSGDKDEVATFEPTIAVAPAPAPAPVDTTPRSKINIWRGVPSTIEHKEHTVDRVLIDR